MSWRGQTVVVTGARGFIGTHVCRKLAAEGAEVHAVSRGDPPTEHDGMRWWKVNLEDVAAVRNAVSSIRPAAIFHLASHVYGSRKLELMQTCLEANLVAAVNLLTVTTELGVGRLVLAGSMEEPHEGDAQAVPASPYAAAKWAAGGYARMFHALYGTPVVHARIAMVYGPGQRDLTKLVPYVALSLLRGVSPKLASGLRKVDWVYVEDVAEGLLAAAQAPQAIGPAIELGSGQLTSVREVVEELARVTRSGAALGFGELAERPLGQEYAADVATTLARTGWKSLVGLPEGLQRTVDWYAVYPDGGAPR